MPKLGRSAAFVKLFSSAIIIQGLLSATNLFVGLVLIRRTSDYEYGTYVLVNNALALLTLMQTAYIQPPLVTRMAQADRTGRADLIGGLYRELRRMLPIVALILVVAAAILWVTGLADARMAIVVFVAIAAATGVLYREFFRIVLLAYRRPFDVLKSDLFYVVIVVVGVMLATLTLPRRPALSAELYRRHADCFAPRAAADLHIDLAHAWLDAGQHEAALLAVESAARLAAGERGVRGLLDAARAAVASFGENRVALACWD